MSSFADIYARALDRHGADALRDRFPTVRTEDELAALPDDRALAEITRHVFAAGFQWRVIEAKWAGFEAAFHGFDVDRVAEAGAAEVEALCGDARIVRNRAKVLATVHNAGFVREVRQRHGGFGRWLAAWPASDTIGLWAALQAGGQRLGGDTGPWVLRHLGKDTFRLSPDVVAALIEAGVIDKAPSGKRALAAVQAAFDAWTAESGLTLGAVSVVLACSVGERSAHGH